MLSTTQVKRTSAKSCLTKETRSSFRSGFLLPETKADEARKPKMSENPIIQYFAYAHLPQHLRGVSAIISSAATLLNAVLPDGPEKSTGLRKLLEAKDCFVRSALNSPNAVVAGDLSDGYHSFNELYAHRMQLFAVICHQNQAHAWKSALHHDGSMFDDYFIVGVNTPLGQFTYHYHMKHWNLFEVQELQRAPEWDGHTADHVMRLHSLDSKMMTEHERMELDAHACRLAVLEAKSESLKPNTGAKIGGLVASGTGCAVGFQTTNQLKNADTFTNMVSRTSTASWAGNGAISSTKSHDKLSHIAVTKKGTP